MAEVRRLASVMSSPPVGGRYGERGAGAGDVLSRMNPGPVRRVVDRPGCVADGHGSARGRGTAEDSTMRPRCGAPSPCEDILQRIPNLSWCAAPRALRRLSLRRHPTLPRAGDIEKTRVVPRRISVARRAIRFARSTGSAGCFRGFALDPAPATRRSMSATEMTPTARPAPSTTTARPTPVKFGFSSSSAAGSSARSSAGADRHVVDGQGSARVPDALRRQQPDRHAVVVDDREGGEVMACGELMSMRERLVRGHHDRRGGHQVLGGRTVQGFAELDVVPLGGSGPPR